METIAKRGVGLAPGGGGGGGVVPFLVGVLKI